MAFSRGSRSGLSYITETTFGTTPAGSFNPLPYTTHSLAVSKDRVQGNDIRSDRMQRVDRHGNKQAGGDIVVDLRADVYDAFLESAMFSSFSTVVDSPDELKVGVTQKSFSIEDYMAGIDQARLFTGMVVSQAAFSIAPNQMVSSTFTMMGKGGTISATEKTLASEVVRAPFDAYSGSLELADSGGVLSSIAVVTGIDFSINNNINPAFVIGSSETPELIEEMATIEGTITAFVEDTSLLDRFLDETETALKVAVNDPTAANEYSFYFPRVKFNGADIPVSGQGARTVTIPFVAIYDTTEDSNLVIYRPSSL